MEEKILKAIENPLKEIGVNVLKVYTEKEEGQDTLYIVIDSGKGVDMDLCVKATNIINPIIDSLDIDMSNYILDVGSKGVEN